MSAYTDQLTVQRAAVQSRLDAYLAAELKILQSQRYRVGAASTGRESQRADLAPVQKAILELRAELAAIDAQLTPATAPRRVMFLR